MILGAKAFQNLVEKGENAGNQNFLHLPQCSEALDSFLIESQHCVIKG